MCKLKIIILILFQWPLLSYAAGPMMHVVLGEAWMAQHAPEYDEEQKKLFLLGTLFPDVRYLGTIERKKTHYRHVTLAQIQNEPSPFFRGVLLHSFVDEFREKWIKTNQTTDKIKELQGKRRTTFLKLVEDQILYPSQSWMTIRRFLLTIPEEEKKYGLDDKTLTEWHTLLAIYFTASPEVILIKFGLLEKDIMNIKAVEIKTWSQLLPAYVADRDIQVYVKNLIEDFNQVIRQSA